MAVVKEYFFDGDMFNTTLELFPESISTDDWIVYHGTSGVCENEIERNGFLPNTNIVTREEVQAVVSIYEKMNWCGDHTGGYAVLKSFSLEHDLADPRGKPVYFAESSCRAALYATREYSAGECARAMRHALSDLHEYLESAALRETHDEVLRSEFEYLQFSEDLYLKVVSPVDLVWLKEELNKIESLPYRCRLSYETHSHGVVYAVRFSETDLRTMEYHTSMGIKCFCQVPPEHIVAKVIIPPGFQWPLFCQDNRRLDVICNKRGLYAIL